jgi:hypothetical protein
MQNLEDTKNGEKPFVPKKQDEKEPELRLEYVAKIRRIEKEKPVLIKNIDNLFIDE